MKILLIMYDNGAFINQLPIGLAQLCAILEKAGHDVDLYLQDVYHYPEAHLTKQLDDNNYDFVGLSFIGGYWQFKKAVAIATAVNASRKRPFFCLGGHGPSPEPAYFLRKLQADAVCIGEGDATILELLDAVEGNTAFGDVKGIAWRDGDDVHENERREPIVALDDLPLPAYHKFPMEIYRLQRLPHAQRTDFVTSIISGRGCPYKCNFCYRMDPGFRPRGNQSIIEEILLLKRQYGVTYIAFQDELLMSSKNRVLSLCEDMRKSDLNIHWSCNGRLNFAFPDVLSAMYRAGCVFINYGIEALDDRILDNMHKNLVTEQIILGIEATLAAGISPGFNIIFGNIGENRETLMKGVDFLLKYDDGSQLRTIRPVTPYPGSELYYKAIEWGLLEGVKDFYEKKHINSDLLTVNFTELTDDEYYAALHEANSILLENYYKKQSVSNKKSLDSLYFEKNSFFRGFRHT